MIKLSLKTKHNTCWNELLNISWILVKFWFILSSQTQLKNHKIDSIYLFSIIQWGKNIGRQHVIYSWYFKLRKLYSCEHIISFKLLPVTSIYDFQLLHHTQFTIWQKSFCRYLQHNLKFITYHKKFENFRMDKNLMILI